MKTPRLGTIGQVLTGLGVLTLLLEASLETRMGFAGAARVSQGEVFGGAVEDYAMPLAGEVPAREYPDVSFHLVSIDVVVGDDDQYERAEAALLDLKVSPAQPMLAPWLQTVPITGGKVTLDRFDISPCLVVKSPETEPRGYCGNLGGWMPGSPEDHIDLPDPRATLRMRFFPDFDPLAPEPTSKSMRMDNPVLWLRVEPLVEGAEPKEQFLSLGDQLVLEPYTFTLHSYRKWAYFWISQQPRVHLGHVGGGLLAAGLLVLGGAFLRSRRAKSESVPP